MNEETTKQTGVDFLLKPVTVHFGGQERSLAFNANAEIQFTTITGLDLVSTLIEMIPSKDKDGNLIPGRAPSIVLLRALLWAALIDGDPDITLDEVGKHLTYRTFADLGGPLGEALRRYLPDPKTVPQKAPVEKKRPKESRVTGVASTKSAD